MVLCRDGAYHKAFLKLLSSGLEISSASSVWNYLYRQTRNAGQDALSREIRQRMTDAGLYSMDIALDDADRAVRTQDYERARLLIEAAAGAEPDDPSVRHNLFRAVEGTDPNRALSLIRDAAKEDIEAALRQIDLLRREDRLGDAMSALDEATSRFGDVARLQVRRARVLEALQDWDAALDTWRGLLADNQGDDPAIWLRVVQLTGRLQRPQEREAAVISLLVARPDALAHVDLAAMLDDTQLLEAALEQYCATASEDDAADAKLLEALLNTGQVGLARYLVARRGPIASPLTEMLDDVRRRNRWPETPRSTTQAATFRSPSCLLPLPATTQISGPNYSFDPRTDKVLLVNSSLNAGGAERQFVMLVSALLAQGMARENIHVALFSLVAEKGQAHFLGDLQAHGVAIHDLRADYRNASRDEVFDPVTGLLPAAMRRDVAMLQPLVRRLRPKVIHAWQDRPAMSAGWVSAQELTPRFVISTRNMTPARRSGTPIRVDRALMRALASSPNTVLSANSIAGARDYEEWLALPDETARVLPNGVEVPSRLPARHGKKGTIRIHGVFRFSPAKRPLLWLETVARLQQLSTQTIELRLFGTGPLERDMRRHAVHLGLRNLEIVTGEKRRDVIFSGADLVLLMSEVEGTPNVLLEAQAEGIAVAGCDVGGTRDAMHAPGDGAGAGSLLFPKAISADQAADRLLEWLPGALKAPRRPRQEFIRRNFSSEALGRIALGFYQQPPGEE